MAPLHPEPDRALGAVLTRHLRQMTDATGALCPPADTLAAYVELGLPAAERARWDAHISTCLRCQASVALIVRSMPQDDPAVQDASWLWRLRFVGPLAAAAMVVVAVYVGREQQTARSWTNSVKQSVLGQNIMGDDRYASASGPGGVGPTPMSPPPTDPERDAPPLSESVAATRATDGAVNPRPARADQVGATPTVEELQASAREALARAEKESADAANVGGQGPNRAPAPGPRVALEEKKQQEPTPNAPSQFRRDLPEQQAPIQSQTASQTPGQGPGASQRPQPAPAPPASGAGAQKPNEIESQRERVTLTAEAGQSAGVRSAVAGGRARTTSGGRVEGDIDALSGLVQWRLGSEGRVERSPDRGATWVQMFRVTSAPLRTISAPSDSVCWIAGDGGLIYRFANGQWDKAAPPSDVAVVRIEARNALAATVTLVDGSTRTTTDGGRSWQ